MLLGAASAYPVVQPQARVQEPFDQLLIQLKAPGVGTSLLDKVEALIKKSDSDLKRDNSTCQAKEAVNAAKLAKHSAELQDLKSQIGEAEKAVESQRDKINADMGLIKSIRLMLKAQSLKPGSRRLLTANDKPSQMAISNSDDATKILTQLLQTPPKTAEEEKHVHTMLDSLENKLKLQLSNHADKDRLAALKEKAEQSSVEKATAAQHASEFALSCSRKLAGQKVFIGLAKELLKMKEECHGTKSAPSSKDCTCQPEKDRLTKDCNSEKEKINKDCNSQKEKINKDCNLQKGKINKDCNSQKEKTNKDCNKTKAKLAKQERLLSSCLAREMTLKADVMLATNTTKAALDKVTACQGKKATMGQHEQFKTFKSFVYSKLATVVKTSSLAIERERKVTSTVRKENSALRMRLEAAYESTKSGMQLRTLESKNKWCQEKLSAVLSGAKNSSAPH